MKNFTVQLILSTKTMLISNPFLFFLILLFILIPNPIQSGCNPYNPKHTLYFGFYWGSAAIEGIGGVKVGDVVRAYVDAVKINGGCVGFFKVKEANFYGAMPVYADDQTTPEEKDGVSEGDVIRFTICHEGKEYLCRETAIWDAGKINDRERLDITTSSTVIAGEERPGKEEVKNTNVEGSESPSPNQTVTDQKPAMIAQPATPSGQKQTSAKNTQGNYRTSITRFSGGSGGEDVNNNQKVKALTNIPPASPAHKSIQGVNQEGYSEQMLQDNYRGSTNEVKKENDKKNSGLTIIPKEFAGKESPEPVEEQVFDTSGLRASLYNQYGEIPIVADTFPGDGDVLATKELSAIKLIFNQSMENGTVEKSFTIKPEVEGRFEWKNRLSELDFIPSEPLLPGVSYLICITDKAKDLYGRPLDGNKDGKPEGDFCFSFKIEEIFEKTDAGHDALPISPRVSRCFISTINCREFREVTLNHSHAIETLSDIVEYCHFDILHLQFFK